MIRSAMIILTSTAAIAAASTAGAFTREPVLTFDKSIDHVQVDQIEDGISGRRDPQGRRQELRQPYGRPVATAIGNLLTIDAAANSTVIVNSLQINRGNQVAINGEIDLD